jgi:hypothetical protein
MIWPKKPAGFFPAKKSGHWTYISGTAFLYTKLLKMEKRDGSFMTGLKTLLFIYNTDSGVLQSLKDYSTGKADDSGPDTCALSAITHSPVGMKKEWKRYIKDLKTPSRSLDRNEFFSEFGHREITCPVVLLEKGTELSVFISTEELKNCRDLRDLISLVNERLIQD